MSQSTILEEIVRQRRRDVAAAKEKEPLELLRLGLDSAPATIDFHARLLRAIVPQQSYVAVIGEIKRASPSKGDIALGADAPQTALTYARGGVAAISVLTEPTWFKGSLKDLNDARRAVEIDRGSTNRPAFLRKDFIVDEYQVVEARLAGADSVLLIVACLTDAELSSLTLVSRSLGMEPLVEVNNENEMKRALALGARVIGVNNRNLHTFSVDMKTTSSLADMVPRDGPILLAALSGITGRTDVAAYEKQGVRVILVGEALMVAEDKDKSGLIKVCGIKTADAAVAAASAGCDLMGLIFAPSKRRVSIELAQQITQTVCKPERQEQTIGMSASSPLDLRTMRDKLGRPLIVGVFADQPAELINQTAKQVNLDLIQLHGQREPPDFPSLLVRPCIRAVHVTPDDTIGSVRERLDWHEGHAVLCLLDTGIKGSHAQGGSGKEFDWTIATELARQGRTFLLAGGLHPDNVGPAIAKVSPFGVDVSSGVEDSLTGQKDLEKVAAFVQNARSAFFLQAQQM